MYYKSIAFSITLLLCVCKAFTQKSQPDTPSARIFYSDTTKVTESVLMLYADSVNKITVTKKIPDFLLNECIDKTPPLFVGFHGSFRWMILQEVTNLSSLKCLIDSENSVRQRLEARCDNIGLKKTLYDNLSSYELLKLRYKELCPSQ